MRRVVCIGVVLAALTVAVPARAAYTPVAQWGTTTPGHVHLGDPLTGMAVGSTGTVYASGTAITRQFVMALDPSGSVLWKVVNSPGESGIPYGVAVDGAGNAYSGDAANCRVRKFSASGVPIGTWGSCGTGDGQFGQDGIHDVAIGPNGNLYVGDIVNNRITEFSTSGTFIRKWMASNPYGVALDSAGTVYTASPYTTGGFVRRYDALGNSLGDWDVGNYPVDVSVGSGDQVYVAFSLNYGGFGSGANQVRAYDTAGTQTGTIGSGGTGDGQFGDLSTVVVSSDAVYAGSSNTPFGGGRRIQKFDRTSGVFLARWDNTVGNTGSNQFLEPLAITQAPDGSFYVVDDDGNTENSTYRVTHLDRDGAFINRWTYSVSTGFGTDVAVTPAGEVLITTGNTIERYDANGTHLGTFSSSGLPDNIAVDQAGNVYAVSAQFRRVTKYSSAGTQVGQWNPGLAGLRPMGIDVDPSGNMWVADKGHHQVVKLDPGGTVVARVGGLGIGSGQFWFPYDVDADASGDVYVADSVNNRIQKLAPDGSFVTQWGSGGAASGQLDSPSSVVADDTGDILVADADNDRIQRFRDTAGFPRPKAATPIYATLVPAYGACGSPNRMHAPPLSFDSCAPPVADSPRLTVGTPDANGQPAKSVSSLKFIVSPGNPSTPADEADVHFFASITDVRQTSDLADYTGELEARIPLTITDKLNSPYPAGRQAGTTVTFPFSFAIPCSATGDTTIGASCDLHTTAETILPGSVTEGARAIWQAGPVEVRDGGDDSDGDTPADDSPFLRQGVFVP